MPRIGERSNYFIRGRDIIMLAPGHKERIVPSASVSGCFVGIREMVVKKLTRTNHWIVIELDNDNMGPTKGVYLDAENYNAVCGVVALFRSGRVLKEGDEIAIQSGENNIVRISINGTPVLPNEGDMNIFLQQNNSFESMLDAIRGEHRAMFLNNEAESECYINVVNLIKDNLWLMEKETIKSIVVSHFLPELKPDSTFEEIFPLLKRKFND